MRLFSSITMAALLSASTIWSTQVTLSGQVKDGSGKPLSGAVVSLVNAGFTTYSESAGKYYFNTNLETRVTAIEKKSRNSSNPFSALAPKLNDGILSFQLANLSPVEIKVLNVNGSEAALLLKENLSQGRHAFAVSQLTAGKRFPRNSLLMIRAGNTNKVFSLSETIERKETQALAKSAAIDDTLYVSKEGYLNTSKSVSSWEGDAPELSISEGTLVERIQKMIGANNSFRMAYLKKEPVAGTSPQYFLYSLDFSDRKNSDTLNETRYADSKEAIVPSISPDGKYIAYGTGVESLNRSNSRIFIQPFGSTRVDGPDVTSTNPRWIQRGQDMWMMWCTSTAQYAWNDKTTKTVMKKFSAGKLSGNEELIENGSYNGGLSPDEKYLAAGYPRGVMYGRAEKKSQYFHVYGGGDSVQICNASISQDPMHTNRFLFLDFGINPSSIKNNIVVPKYYAQHEIILIGEFGSSLGGGIVDYINSPPSHLANSWAWEDPEWSTHPNFAVATARGKTPGCSGLECASIHQWNLYLINLKTKESIKVFDADGAIQPVAWIGLK